MSGSLTLSIKNDIVLEHCRGITGCPNAVVSGGRLLDGLRSLPDILTGFITESAPDEAVMPHRRFRISLSLCPNGCSRPQIADVGVIGAAVMKIDPGACTGCGACVAACRELALEPDEKLVPRLNHNCINCGDCLRVCPFDAITPARTGFRVLLGGKLGRHPQFGTELEGLYSEKEVLDIVSASYMLFRSFDREIRFGEIINRQGLSWLPGGLVGKES